MEKKTSVLAVLEILRQESDRDHPLTAAQIQQKMEQQYQCPIERRTLYANIQMLKEFGYEISTYHKTDTDIIWITGILKNQKSCFCAMPSMRQILFPASIPTI